MRKFVVIAALCVLPSLGASATEKRCGWIVNPTPGNWWLTDSQADWIMATQGDDRDPGMEHVPDISAHDFVKTNGEYGYACGCMDGDYDAKTHRVLKITGFTQKTIDACKKDKALKPPA